MNYRHSGTGIEAGYHERTGPRLRRRVGLRIWAKRPRAREFRRHEPRVSE